MALSPIPFCPCDGHQTGLWYLPARWRDTTESAQGLLPAWAGSPLAGRVSRPLDGKQSGSLVISGVPNYLIFQANKAYPDRSRWIRWNKCLTFRMP